MAININKHFGKEVEKYRKQKEISQLELAELSKVDLSTINRIERGISNLALRNAFKITKALHIPIYKFFLTDKATKKLDRNGQIAGEPIDKPTQGVKELNSDSY